MFRVITFLVFLVFSVWLGLEVVKHPGFMLIVYQPWMVQIPIWLTFLGLLIIFGLFYLLIASIDQVHFLVFRLKNWLRFRKEHQSFSKTQYGLSALIEGKWQKAERLLLAGMTQTFEPLINFLGAAKAAHAQGAFDRRDSYIEQAYQMAPQADLAIGLTLAELQIDQNQLEQALATLNHLNRIAPRHPHVLKLLEKVYVRLGDWKNLQLLLPSMQKTKILSEEKFERLEKNIYQELLTRTPAANLESLRATWNGMPKAVKKRPEIIAAYVKELLRFKEYTESESLLRAALKQTYHPDLIKLYSTLPFDNLNRQLVIAGAWLKQYGQRPELLLLLGQLCMRVQLWGKAKDYFEKCLRLGPNIEASLEYGKLLEQLNESTQATDLYKKSLLELSIVKETRIV